MPFSNNAERMRLLIASSSSSRKMSCCPHVCALLLAVFGAVGTVMALTSFLIFKLSDPKELRYDRDSSLTASSYALGVTGGMFIMGCLLFAYAKCSESLADAAHEEQVNQPAPGYPNHQTL